MAENDSIEKRADELEIGNIIIIYAQDIKPILQFPFLKAKVWKKETKKGKFYLYLETENQVFVKTRPLIGDELFRLEKE